MNRDWLSSVYDAETNEYLGEAGEDLIRASEDASPTGIVYAHEMGDHWCYVPSCDARSTPNARRVYCDQAR